jgi:hypothetical protein
MVGRYWGEWAAGGGRTVMVMVFDFTSFKRLRIPIWAGCSIWEWAGRRLSLRAALAAGGGLSETRERGSLLCEVLALVGQGALVA